MGQIRTSWDLTPTVGIPFSRWGARPFVHSPIPFPAGVIDEIAPGKKERGGVVPERPHPFALAQLWCREMEMNPTLKAKIAAREGISRARVTQIMDLLRLPMEIQKDLACPPSPLRIHSFPERQTAAACPLQGRSDPDAPLEGIG